MKFETKKVSIKRWSITAYLFCKVNKNILSIHIQIFKDSINISLYSAIR
jgi:hypothetical protein